MEDMNNMLGLSGGNSVPQQLSLESVQGKAPPPKKLDAKSVKKPKGMSRETFDLLSDAMKLELVQVSALGKVDKGPQFKSKRSSALKGKWVWADVPSTARGDDSTPFYHWVKADFRYNDYPYAKFNVKLDTITYTDDEYTAISSASLEEVDWSREDTDALFAAVCQFDMRWQVIADRIELAGPVARSIEDLQVRFSKVVTALKELRKDSGKDLHLYNTTVPSDCADIEKERFRKLQMDVLFKLNEQKASGKQQSLDFLKSAKGQMKEDAADALKKNRKAGKPPGPKKEQDSKGWGRKSLAQLQQEAMEKERGAALARGETFDPSTFLSSYSAPSSSSSSSFVDGVGSPSSVVWERSSSKMQSALISAPLPGATKKKQEATMLLLRSKYSLDLETAVFPTAVNAALVEQIAANALALLEATKSEKEKGVTGRPPLKKLKKEKDPDF